MADSPKSELPKTEPVVVDGEFQGMAKSDDEILISAKKAREWKRNYMREYMRRRRRWNAFFAKLEKFYALEDDWGGEGSPAPEISLINSAVSYFVCEMKQGEMSSPGRASVTPEGSLVVEWQPGANKVIELEIDKLGHGELMTRVVGGKPKFEDVNWDKAMLLHPSGGWLMRRYRGAK